MKTKFYVFTIGLLAFAMSNAASADEDYGYQIKRSRMDGKAAIAKILETEKQWLSFGGESSSVGSCYVYILTPKWKDFLEVVMTDVDKKPVARFYVNDQSRYQMKSKRSDNSFGEGVGFYSYYEYRAGSSRVTFAHEGDSGYNVEIANGRKKYDCDVGF